MYPIKIGYTGAKSRINKLLENEHFAEALVTSVFTAEKTIRRTLSQLVISAGFTSEHADKIVNKLRGLDSIKEVWLLYDSNNCSLVDVIGNSNWSTLKKVAEMRNDLVHGSRVYKLSECRDNASSVLKVIDTVISKFKSRYGYDGWSVRKSRKKHFLHKDPKVNINKC